MKVRGCSLVGKSTVEPEISRTSDRFKIEESMRGSTPAITDRSVRNEFDKSFGSPVQFSRRKVFDDDPGGCIRYNCVHVTDPRIHHDRKTRGQVFGDLGWRRAD